MAYLRHKIGGSGDFTCRLAGEDHPVATTPAADDHVCARILPPLPCAADRATPINLAQHSYFNRAGHNAGGAGILNHELTIHGDHYTPVGGWVGWVGGWVDRGQHAAPSPQIP